MPGSTTNMGLVTWTNLTDFFSHTDLVNNWTKVDNHDHVPIGSGGNGGLPIPGTGIQNGAITTAKIAANAVTKANLAADVDYEYAFSTYKTLVTRRGTSASAAAAGAYYLLDTRDGLNTMGSTTTVDATSFYFDPADYAAGSRTVKGRLRAQLFTNVVSPASTWVVALYPIATYGGLSGQPANIATVGTAVSGALVTFTNPGAHLALQGASADFTLPSAGHYVLVAGNSVNSQANSVVTMKAQLQVRQV